MEIHIGYVTISILMLVIYPFLGIFLFIHKRIIFSLGNNFLIFAFGTFWGNILFHLFPEAINKLPTKTILFFMPLGIILSWGVDKIMQHMHRDGHQGEINSIAYHLLGNDVLHHFIDGVIVLLSHCVNPISGISTTLSILLHEVPSELCKWSVILKVNFSCRKVLLLNSICSMAAVTGVSAAYLLSQLFHNWTPYFVAIITGNLVFIANAKLLPLVLHSNIPIVNLRSLVIFFSGFLLIGCTNFIHPHLH